MRKNPIIGHANPTTTYQQVRRLCVLAICLVLIGTLTACTEQGDLSEGRKQKNDKVLRYDVNAPFTSLYPAAVKASGSMNIFPLLYSYLFVPNTTGELEPDLATHWAFDADKRQWTIHLRDNVRFHNNHPVTAADVKFSLEAYVSSNRPHLKSTIDRITTVSDTMLVLRLKRKDPLILKKLWNIEIVPHSKRINLTNEHRPIGSGPFKFALRQGTQMVALDANPDYFGDPPALERIVFYYQPDREKAWTRLMSGATDIAQEIAPKNYHIINQYQDRFYFDTSTLSHYTILLYNTSDPLFSNPIVRTALAMGIDRAHIVDHILNGYGRIATGPFGLDSPFHHPKVKPLPYDPSRALDLLHQAGWRPDDTGRLQKEGKPFEFTLLVFKENPVDKKVARFIQLCLNHLGIKAHLQILTYQELVANYHQNTGFQAVLTELNASRR